jgi:hypothetical protein
VACFELNLTAAGQYVDASVLSCILLAACKGVKGAAALCNRSGTQMPGDDVCLLLTVSNMLLGDFDALMLVWACNCRDFIAYELRNVLSFCWGVCFYQSNNVSLVQ